MTDISGGTETLDLSTDHPSTIESWQPTLVPGCYDVVLDVNGDGFFNVETDLTCKFVVGIQNVITEVPFGAAVASLRIIGAAVGLAGFKRFRVKA